MKVKPGIDQVKQIAESGEYKMVPVSCKMLSGILTPIEALRILKNVSTHCNLLESVAEQEKWGRYTFLGFDPKLELSSARLSSFSRVHFRVIENLYSQALHAAWAGLFPPYFGNSPFHDAPILLFC